MKRIDFNKTLNDTSRIKHVQLNIIFGNVGNVVTLLMAFVSRTVFINTLGSVYLGVNGLFTNVLGILSFAELGIGSALNFSLYKPIAENDAEKVKSLMRIYKVCYRTIAVVVAILGLILLPFIGNLVSSEAQFDHLQIYYLIFLFNTVSSYFITYKYSYVTARQEEYVIAKVNTVATIIIYSVQVLALLLFGNFLAYLLIQSGLQLLQKIVTVNYLDKKYPILSEKNVKPLPKKDRDGIISNVKALIIHKIGDACVNQTDNILISVMTSTSAVGLVSNYTILNDMVAKFTNTIFNSFTASFGNLIAKENKHKQREILEVYNFVGYWIYGFVFIAFVTLAQSFIELWIGRDMQIDNLTMLLYFASIYLAGQTFTVYNFKVAAGIFAEDKWYSFIQAVVNLVTSIAAIKMIGLPGVYVGTIISRMVIVISRPYVLYKVHFNEIPIKYFTKCMYNAATIAGIALLMHFISTYVLSSVTIVHFIIMTILTAIIPNIIIALINSWRFEEKYILKFVLGKMKKAKN